MGRALYGAGGSPLINLAPSKTRKVNLKISATRSVDFEKVRIALGADIAKLEPAALEPDASIANLPVLDQT